MVLITGQTAMKFDIGIHGPLMTLLTPRVFHRATIWQNVPLATKNNQNLLKQADCHDIQALYIYFCVTGFVRAACVFYTI